MTRLINRLRSGPEDAFDAVDTMNDAADHIERLEKIIRSAVNMRAQQRAYLKNKTKNALVEAKKAESSFDKMAMEYVTGGNNGHP